MSTSQSQPVPHHRFAIRNGDWTLPLSGSTPANVNGTSAEQPYEVLQTEAALAELSLHLEQKLGQLVLGGEVDHERSHYEASHRMLRFTNWSTASIV